MNPNTVTGTALILLTMIFGCASQQNADPRPPLTEPTVIRVNAGATEPHVDESGNLWEPDGGFFGGAMANRRDILIANTTIPSIYRTERWGMTEFRRSLPNGKYLVRLHFAETYPGEIGPNLRVADIEVHGQRIGPLDVFEKSGGRRIALVEQVRVNVDDRTLLIRFAGYPSTHHAVMINGIEIIPDPDA